LVEYSPLLANYNTNSTNENIILFVVP